MKSAEEILSEAYRIHDGMKNINIEAMKAYAEQCPRLPRKTKKRYKKLMVMTVDSYDSLTGVTTILVESKYEKFLDDYGRQERK